MLAFLAVLAVGPPPATTSASPQLGGSSPAYLRAFEELSSIALDPEKSAHVQSRFLVRDAASFTLEEGQLTLCRPIGGKVCAAVFVGKGTFAFTPPNPIERGQVERFFKTPTLIVPFRALVLYFADSTASELADLTFAAGEPSANATAVLATSLKYVLDRREKEWMWAEPSLLQTLLDGGDNGYFYAHIDRERGDPLFWIVDPYRGEQVSLERHEETRRVGMVTHHVRETICQFYAAGDTTRVKGVRRLVDVEHYRIDLSVAENFAVEQHVDVRFRAIVDGAGWVPFWIDGDMTADSVCWSDGRAAEYLQGHESPLIWVRCEPPLKLGEEATLRLRLSGKKIVVRSDDVMWLPNPVSWYPQHDYADLATFDLMFHVPSQYQFASVGERTSTCTERQVTTTQWRVAEPIRNATFVLGLFQDYEVENPAGVPMSVLQVSPARAGKTEVLNWAERKKTGSQDVLRALDFSGAGALFQHLFGPPPAPHLFCAEIPGWGGGQAFSGLIVSDVPDADELSREGRTRMIRAHEVAHQWWGFGVRPADYHDQWLSEAFAQFSGLLYLQAASGGDRLYLETLDHWAERILTNRLNSLGLGRGQEAGPIWLGWRTSSKDTPGDHALLIYYKGAWVLHMLRNWMLDLDTMSDQRFQDLLADYYRTYRGGEVSTADFEHVVSRHAGEDMHWFFRQWIYGTETPVYRFGWSADPTPEGRVRVHCRVEQSGVPPEFRMDVPILIEFGKDRFARVRVKIQGAVSEFDLPLMDVKPTRVTFNDLHSVLCEVKNDE